MGFLERFRRRSGVAVAAGTMARYSYQNADLASNETIFSAISMLSGAIASLPVDLRKNYFPVKSHPVAQLLEYGPNPNMSIFAFIRCLEVLRDSTGAGYALKELDAKGTLSALWPVRTDAVEPMIDRESREIYYRVQDMQGGEAVYLHHSMVIAVGHISADGLRPLNPIAVLRSSLEYDRSIKEFSIEQMQNGLRAKLAIQLEGAVNPEQIKRYNEVLQKFMKSGVLYLDSGKTIQELKSSSIIDPKVFEVENITIARVARVYNLPLEKFLPDKSSYASAEQADLNYLRDTVLPMARMYEQEFSRKLLTQTERDAGMQIKFSMGGFARADMKTRGEFYMKGVRTGWFCLDDVRSLEDLPPLPDGLGQQFYISKDLIPVEQMQEISRKPGAAESISQGEKIAQVSLNGAQIASILQVVSSVNAGEMAYDSAICLLVSAFPFDEQTAGEILGQPGQHPRTEQGVRT